MKNSCSYITTSVSADNHITPTFTRLPLVPHVSYKDTTTHTSDGIVKDASLLHTDHISTEITPHLATVARSKSLRTSAKHTKRPDSTYGHTSDGLSVSAVSCLIGCVPELQESSPEDGVSTLRISYMNG